MTEIVVTDADRIAGLMNVIGSLNQRVLILETMIAALKRELTEKESASA